MNSRDLEQLLLQELRYVESPGFQYLVEQQKHAIPDVDSAYFVQNIPVAYFSRLSEATPERLQQLHQRVWNQSKVPLLYVILPQEIRVYNGYAEPARTTQDLNDKGRLLQLLDQLTDLEKARQQIRTQLSNYDRLHLETGAFWSTLDGQKIRRESRADQRLLRAMDQVRRHLLDRNLSNDLAYTLLGRSIFIRYLEDRGILTADWISQLTNNQVGDYRTVLHNFDLTYHLFQRLSQRFNGDLFPVDDEKERQIVRQEHLNILGSFLDGDDLDTGQQSFWPYDFRYIPIELISGIYDTFLSAEQRKQLGAYYTPLPLVDFVLNETLPLEAVRSDMTILDPACGSGIFLVRAYQRMVEAQQQDNESLSAFQLGEIMRRSIFGIDIKPEAIRIAAFSLYLAMLHYLDNEEIQNDSFRFPPLEGTNLFISNFFSLEGQNLLSGRKFDRVICNPPWGKNTLTPEAVRWLKENNYTIGGKQIAPAFLLRMPEFCIEAGEIASLAPAKSTILVTSGPHEEFRQKFFDGYNVRMVVNFSALCYELFEDSLSPVVAIFYQPDISASRPQLVYGVPKPSPLSQRLGAIVLDTTEVKFLNRADLLMQPLLWKVALWGTPRDAALIERLKLLPTLEEQAEKLGWKIAEGIQIGGGDENPAPWLQGMPLIPTKQFRRYALDMNLCKPIQATVFHRPRTPDIVRGPLALIRQSPIDRRCIAAFSAVDIAYLDVISGVVGKTGQEGLLKWLVSYINSSLAQYYLFLTSTRWAVERGNIITEEYKRMPFLIPDENSPQLHQVLYRFDQIVELLQRQDILFTTAHEIAVQQHEIAINELIFDLYGLSHVERQLVQDMVDYGIEFFYWAKQKHRKPSQTEAIQPPDTRMLTEYAETFIETVTALLRYQDQTLNAVVYQDGAPLSVVGFELVTLANARKVQVIDDAGSLRETLRRLDKLLLEQHAPALYMRRHVRIYDGSWLYLVRPSERRFWTQSQARADADSSLVEWLSQSISVEVTP